MAATFAASLAAASAAHATQLTVTSNRADCPAAGYTKIQDAVDAAAPFDTISIYPGTYAEGGASVTNNTITGNVFTSDYSASVGVLLVGAGSGTAVTSNTYRATDT